jgi:hypothetical protein
MGDDNILTVNGILALFGYHPVTDRKNLGSGGGGKVKSLVEPHIPGNRVSPGTKIAAYPVVSQGKAEIHVRKKTRSVGVKSAPGIK